MPKAENQEIYHTSIKCCLLSRFPTIFWWNRVCSMHNLWLGHASSNICQKSAALVAGTVSQHFLLSGNFFKLSKHLPSSWVQMNANIFLIWIKQMLNINRFCLEDSSGSGSYTFGHNFSANGLFVMRMCVIHCSGCVKKKRSDGTVGEDRCITERPAARSLHLWLIRSDSHLDHPRVRREVTAQHEGQLLF